MEWALLCEMSGRVPDRLQCGDELDCGCLCPRERGFERGSTFQAAKKLLARTDIHPQMIELSQLEAGCMPGAFTSSV